MAAPDRVRDRLPGRAAKKPALAQPFGMNDLVDRGLRLVKDATTVAPQAAEQLGLLMRQRRTFAAAHPAEAAGLHEPLAPDGEVAAGGPGMVGKGVRFARPVDRRAIAQEAVRQP